MKISSVACGFSSVVIDYSDYQQGGGGGAQWLNGRVLDSRPRGRGF